MEFYDVHLGFGTETLALKGTARNRFLGSNCSARPASIPVAVAFSRYRFRLTDGDESDSLGEILPLGDGTVLAVVDDQ